MTPDWAAKAVTVPYAKFGDPQTLNLYTYVENAPLNRADADGHDPDPCKGRQDCFVKRDEKAQTVTVTQTSTETTVSKNKDGEEISTTKQVTNTETVSTAKADKGTVLGGASTTTVTTSNLSNPGSEPTVQRSTTSLTPLQAKQSVSPELTTGIQEMAQPSFGQSIKNHPVTVGVGTVGIGLGVAGACAETAGLGCGLAVAGGVATEGSLLWSVHE